MRKSSKSTIKPSASKTLADISNEWDQIASVRQGQLTNREDLSFTHVLAPSVFGLLEGCNLDNVIDLGCGTGELTGQIASKASTVVGVDVSLTSIEIARTNCSRSTNVRFYHDSVEDFARKWIGDRFTTAVASMTLMDCLNLIPFIEATASIMDRQGSFVATITHPWYWPIYWGYHNADWFDYHQEVVLEGPFRTSSEVTDRITTHVHRPLSSYMEGLSQAGLVVDRIDEPFPNEYVHDLFPERWEFPRFLALRAHKSA